MAVSSGRNPWAEPKAAPRAGSSAGGNAHVPASRLHCPRKRSGKWSRGYAEKWIMRLEKHVIEPLGDRDVDTITRRELAAILADVCREMPETARKLRQALHLIFRWAVANDYRANNPADDALGELLPQVEHKVTHRKALHYSQVPAAYLTIKESPARDASRLAFHFLILTAARSGEVRRATWEEVDLENALWEIPAERMKAKRSHKVPLSIQAQMILREARERWGNTTGLIFPSDGGKPLAGNALCVRAEKDKLDATPHGYRTSFREWAGESYGASWEVCEISLAHAIGTTVTKAYFRTDLLEERRPMMQVWADHCDPVLPF